MVNNEPTQTFLYHLNELRTRVFICVGFFILAFVCGSLISSNLLKFLLDPIKEPLFYSNPTGGFDTILQVSIFFAALASLPVIVYQILKFVAPAFPNAFSEKTARTLIVSSMLAGLGFSFAYFVCLPATFAFLEKFQSPNLKALITIDQYFSFVSRYLLAFALIFQLPLGLFLINKVTPLSVKGMSSKRIHVIVTSFIFAAIITPTTDIANQFIVALPIILLYEISIFTIWFGAHLRTKKAEEQESWQKRSRLLRKKRSRLKNAAKTKRRFFSE